MIAAFDASIDGVTESVSCAKSVRDGDKLNRTWKAISRTCGTRETDGGVEGS